MTRLPFAAGMRWWLARVWTSEGSMQLFVPAFTCADAFEAVREFYPSARIESEVVDGR